MQRDDLLTRYAHFIAAHARGVLVTWVVVTLAAVAVAAGLFGHLSNSGIYVPHGEAERTMRVLARALPREGESRVFVIALQFRPRRVGEAAVEAAARVLADRPNVEAIRRVASTVHYDSKGRIDMLAGVASVSLALAPPSAERQVSALQDALAHASHGRTRYVLLGDAVVSARLAAIARGDLGRAEAITFPVTLAVLLIAFLSLAAALLPVVLAAAGLAVTFALLWAGWRHSGLSIFVTDTASVLALGLNIDYALFMVTRFREETAAGAAIGAALGTMLATTGRAVLLSGVTIALSALSLLIVGVGIFTSMAIGAVLATLVSLLTALTLLPALLAILGPRIDRLGLGRVARAARGARVWTWIADAVTARPAQAASASLLIMLVLAAPMLSMRLGFHSTSALPRDEPVRRASDQVAVLFGRGAVGTVDVVTRDSGSRVQRALAEAPGVANTWGLVRRGGWWAMHAVLRDDPDGAAARATVEHLHTRLQDGRRATLIGGPTQAQAELMKRIGARTPAVVLVACLLAGVALVAGFRSLLVPLKALLTSLLSIAATLGLVWRLFPSSPGAPTIEFFVPLFLFAIIFGLSVDYEVFLLSRIREAVEEGRPNRDAVRIGLIRSARSITLAGATLVTVFLAFMTSQLYGLQQLGGGVAIAIILDVTLVRCVLVPATVTLLGRWNWWLPQPPRKLRLARRR